MTGPTPPTAAAQLSRLLALVPWLVAHDGVTLTEAARHFGVSEQQLEKDLYLLICSGLPGHGPDQLVDIQFWDEGGRIHVVDPQTLDRPLRLSAEEATALLLGLRLLAQVPGDHDREALAAATDKLERAAGAAAATTARVAVEVEDAGEVGADVAAALRGGRAVRLRYLTESRDEVTERVVDPMRVLVVGGRTYLEGWCRRAEAVRTFRLDRVEALEVLDEPARPPADATPHDLVDATLRPAGGVATLDLAPAARWVADVHPVDAVEELPGGGLRVVLPVGDLAWAVRLLLSVGGDATVVDPPELVAAVREAAAAALAAYPGSPDP